VDALSLATVAAALRDGSPSDHQVGAEVAAVIAQLLGTDGNIFAILGKTARYLREADRGDLAESLMLAINSCHSYESALGMCISALTEAGYTVN
jgi:hypothetical protein